jgi:PAS domain-containing protein
MQDDFVRGEPSTHRTVLPGSDQLFRQFAEASLDVLWLRDAKTLQWEYVSPGFEAVYGLSREQARKTTCLSGLI